MAAPCGAIIYYLATITGLTSIASYYGLTSNSSAPANLPLSKHIGTVVATNTVQAVLNTFAPTVHHSLRIEAPPPPQLSIVLYPVQPKFSAPVMFLLSSGETIVSHWRDTASPNAHIPTPFTAFLYFLIALMLLIASSAIIRGVYHHIAAIAATKLATKEVERLKAEHFAKVGEMKKLINEWCAEIDKFNKLKDECHEKKKKFLHEHIFVMDGLRARVDKERNKLIDENALEFENIVSEHLAKKNKLINDNSLEIDTINREHSAKKEKLINDHRREINTIANQHSAKKQKLGTDNYSEITKLIINHSTEFERIEDKNAAELDELNAKHSSNIKQLTDDNSKEIEGPNTEAAEFMPAANGNATASNASSNRYVNEIENRHADANASLSKMASANQAVPIHPPTLMSDNGFVAVPRRRNGARSIDRSESSQAIEGSNIYSVLAVDDPAIDDQEALTEEIGGDGLATGFDSSIHDDIIESAQPHDVAPSTDAAAGCTEAKPERRRTTRGKGRKIKYKN